MQISVLLATAEPFLVCAVAVISSLCRRTCRTKPILLLVLDQGFCSLFGEWCTSFTVLVQADQRLFPSALFSRSSIWHKYERGSRYQAFAGVLQGLAFEQDPSRHCPLKGKGYI